MDKNLLGRRIKQRRQELDMTQGDIANAIGVAISTVQRYETGAIDKIKLPVIESIARAIQVSPDWLCGKTDVSAESTYNIVNLSPMPKMKKIPLLGKIACGEPILADENIEKYIDIPEHIHADFSLVCKGDSMIGARIYDGDIVYIRQQADVENGEIAAVLIGDEATLKRVYKHPDRLILQPENPSFPPLVYVGNEIEAIRIIGKAIAFTSLVKH
nr:MAG TPA: Repressor protein CI [Caudoviricetes sp.]